MACRTCTHTMQAIADKVFWCPRCGSLKFQYAKGGDEWSEPKLIHRAFSLCEIALDLVAEFTSFHDETDNCIATEQCEQAVRECCLPPDER